MFFLNQFMKVARDLAQENLVTNDGGPFGACVVKDGNIIGKGRNQVLALHDPTAHSEMQAIREACKKLNSHDLSECIIYSTSYPCPMCLSAIMWANIKTVYYGNTKEDTAMIGFRDDFIYHYIDQLNHNRPDQKVLSLISMDHDETWKEYEKFMKKEDKTLY